VPVIRPVEVEKLSPAARVEGLIEYDVGVPPVFEMEYKPLTALSTFAVADERENEIDGASTRVAITMVRPTEVLGVVDGYVSDEMLPSLKRIMLTPLPVTA
jgi:hypothetical protein